MSAKEKLLVNDVFEVLSDVANSVYIYVTDVTTRESRWSQSAVKYFDMPGEYIYNARNIWLEKVHPEDREQLSGELDGVFSGLTKRHSCQYRVMNRYGTYVWVECNGKMIYDEEGNQKIFGGIITRLDVQSKYDPLTGVLSKNELFKYDFRNNEGVAIMVNIDDFRKIGVTYGVIYADNLLTELGRYLNELCKNGAVYRFHGDEFIIVLPEISDEEAMFIHESICDFVKTRGLEAKDIMISITSGAIKYPINNYDTDDILNSLELTVDYAKSRRRGGLLYFNDEIEKVQMRYNTLKRELKSSIMNGFKGFELYYQPWINAKGTEIVGCEALLRWKGETIKDSGPGEFIPILEMSDDIVEVGYWVMEEAIKQQKEWQVKFGNFKVSFNVSYKQFLVPGYEEALLNLTQKYGVDADNLVLELTESCDVETPEKLARIFGRIKEKGYHIALDDFGTGYSSMELLKKVPATGIKIEHSFVRELEKTGHDVDFAIIEAILVLCKKLDCEVVVEGIENEEVDGIIRQMDVRYLQGYYYSRPVCKEDFEKMLEANYMKCGLL